jgi:hypothetical protein
VPFLSQFIHPHRPAFARQLAGTLESGVFVTSQMGTKRPLRLQRRI